MSRTVFSAWITLLVTLTFVGSSFVTPFSGFEPDVFPVPQDNPPAQPAGYAFSIWGVIYLWLIASAVFGVSKRAADPAWSKVRGPLIGSLAIGTFWLAVATKSPIGSTIMIWLMFGLALWALLRTPDTDRLWLRTPIALYAGWLAAASSVSIALVGAGYGIAFDGVVWAFVVTVGATLLAVTIIRQNTHIAEFGIAVVWALIAIAVKSANDDTALAIVAGGCAMIVAGVAVLAATGERA